MENLKKVYDLNSKYILGGNNKFLKNLREDLIENFVFDNNLNKNNESIKHIDPRVLNELNFNTNNQVLNYEFLNDDKSESSLVVKNGSHFSLMNIDKKKAIFDTINSNLDFLVTKLENNKNHFKDDYIVNLNSIFLNSGFHLRLKKNNNLELSLVHTNDQYNNTIYAKNFFHIEKNSKLVLIEKFSNKTKSNSNIINYFELDEGSEVTHLVVQNNIDSSNLQFTSHANCHKNAKFNQLIFNCSDTSLRNHHYASLIGQNSEANLKGIFFARKNQIIDNKTEISHLDHSCISNQTYKGILTDKSKASYLSKTFVDKKAQKTDGYQLSKGILLSDDAYFFSKPELRIYADDVKCSHGSTIGPFNYEEIFYLRSRGLSEKKAKSLLIKSFCQDLLTSIKKDKYLIGINQLVDNWLSINAI